MSWDEEYSRGGVPSSYRDDPSGAVVCAMERARAREGDGEFLVELEGFDVVDSLARRKEGDMHGAVYERHTLTTIFTSSTPAACRTSWPSSTA